MDALGVHPGTSQALTCEQVHQAQVIEEPTCRCRLALSWENTEQADFLLLWRGWREAFLDFVIKLGPRQAPPRASTFQPALKDNLLLRQMTPLQRVSFASANVAVAS